MQTTLKSHTIFCHDNLPILRGVNSNSIDLIYLDPPFNKGKKFHAPVGSEAEGADFDDIWHEESVKDEWHEEIKAKQPRLYKYLDAVGDIGSRSAKYYLIYMAVRLFEMHRILKETGSLYLHCDPTASHYLKLLLDTIFGTSNFMNEVVWNYGKWSNVINHFQKNHDVILYYAKKQGKHIFIPLYVEKQTTTPYHTNIINGQGQLLIYEKENTPEAVIEKYKNKGYQVVYVRKKGVIENDTWTYLRDKKLNILNSQAKERTGYPTQKPLALVERIIEASCPAKGLVLDPFCGCATTCIAASRLEREWIGIDVSPKAFELVKTRLKNEVPEDFFRSKPIYREDIPTRTDVDYKRNPTKEDKFFMFGKQNGKCNGCKIHFPRDNFDIDHIIPKSDGGGNERGNLQLLCPQCNKIKGNRSMAFLMAQPSNN